MQIMLDTNILLSASVFPNERMNRIIDFIVANHTLVLSDVVIAEFLEVANYDKFKKLSAAQELLKNLNYTEYKTPNVVSLKDVSIRDEDDYAILFSAIESAVDIFITRDKDFLECGVLIPRMLTLNDFESEFMRGGLR